MWIFTGTQVIDLSWFVAVKDLVPDSSALAKKGLNCVLQTSNAVNFILFLCSWTNIGLVRDICYSSTCWTAWINNGSFQKQFISISCCSWGENCHLNQMVLMLIFEGMSKPFKNRRTKADEEQIYLFTCKCKYRYREQPIPELAGINKNLSRHKQGVIKDTESLSLASPGEVKSISVEGMVIATLLNFCPNGNGISSL